MIGDEVLSRHLKYCDLRLDIRMPRDVISEIEVCPADLVP